MSAACLAHLLLIENPSFNPEGDFCLHNNLIKLKTNSLPQTMHQNQALRTYTFSGMGIYRPELFAGCQAGSFRLAPLLREYIPKNSVQGELMEASWFDAGTQQRLQQIEEFIRS